MPILKNSYSLPLIITLSLFSGRVETAQEARPL